MLTYPQIVKRTPTLRKENSKYAVVAEPRFGYTADGHAFVAARTWTTKVKDSYGHIVRKPPEPKYVTVVEFLDKSLHVNISCSCPDFLYRFEVALSLKDAYQIEYSNGALPVVTNPALRAACCKHCIAMYSKIKGIMNQGIFAPLIEKNK